MSGCTEKVKMMLVLDESVRYVKGVGEAKAKSLEKLGITSLRSLVTYFPRSYEDRTAFKRIGELEPGEDVCVKAMVAARPVLSFVRKGMELVRLRAVDETGTLSITYFNQKYVRDQLVAGRTYVFYGRIGGTRSRPEMTNPVFEPDTGKLSVTGRIMPLYRLTAGVSQGLMAKVMAAGLKLCADALPDALPEEVRTEYELAQARFAYENIHFPDSAVHLEIARRRLVFEELYVLTCALARLRGSRRKEKSAPVAADALSGFTQTLPFALTGAQKRALSECAGDMSGRTPMSRLVQGDVGSGKTVVAAGCCWLCAKAGKQAAVMAPTEILARQHYATFSKLLEPLGVRVGLLTGGQTAAARRETLKRTEAGEVDVLVGTHALLSEGVTFRNLALAVVDEQHRFGVQQRSRLTEKGESPHVLVMSATPIPRTLALMIYGDLDVSVIDELPPGRKPVKTFAVNETMHERVYAFIRRQVEQGRQAYIVCPAVGDETLADDGRKAAVRYAQTLQEQKFPDLRVALVHGRMKPKEKESVMAAFAAGDIQILVATTVIEVGVDVPNASVMVVENADRFGLSQLHQLRGRVGRGSHESFCILFEGAGGETAKQRLEALCRTNDGFEIAEEDLKLRGPGDFFGDRQHGLPELKIADFAENMDILYVAQAAAQKTLAADPQLTAPEHRPLACAVEEMLTVSGGTMN